MSIPIAAVKTKTTAEAAKNPRTVI